MVGEGRGEGEVGRSMFSRNIVFLWTQISDSSKHILKTLHPPTISMFSTAAASSFRRPKSASRAHEWVSAELEEGRGRGTGTGSCAFNSDLIKKSLFPAACSSLLRPPVSDNFEI